MCFKGLFKTSCVVNHTYLTRIIDVKLTIVTIRNLSAAVLDLFYLGSRGKLSFEIIPFLFFRQVILESYGFSDDFASEEICDGFFFPGKS